MVEIEQHEKHIAGREATGLRLVYDTQAVGSAAPLPTSSTPAILPHAIWVGRTGASEGLVMASQYRLQDTPGLLLSYITRLCTC